MKHSILIIDDDRVGSRSLQDHFNQVGYVTDVAFNGAVGLKKAVRNDYDIILLDAVLPKLDGFQVLKALREQKQTPVLILTKKNSEKDRIYGFQCGADDYVIKPYNMTELLLRIQAILRRSEKTLSPNLAVLNSGMITFNKHLGTVNINDKNVCLTPIEFELLYALVQEQGEVLSKPYLYQYVLLREFKPYDRTLDMHISKIRKKVHSAGMSIHAIKTVRGKGYCFEEQKQSLL